MSRFVRVQPKKRKYAKDTLQAFKKKILKKNTLQEFWVNKGTNYREQNQSLKLKTFRYFEDLVEKIVPKLQQLVSTLGCHKNQSIENSPRDVKIVIFYQ